MPKSRDFKEELTDNKMCQYFCTSTLYVQVFENYGLCLMAFFFNGYFAYSLWNLIVVAKYVCIIKKLDAGTVQWKIAPLLIPAITGVKPPPNIPCNALYYWILHASRVISRLSNNNILRYNKIFNNKFVLNVINL